MRCILNQLRNSLKYFLRSQPIKKYLLILVNKCYYHFFKELIKRRFFFPKSRIKKNKIKTRFNVFTRKFHFKPGVFFISASNFSLKDDGHRIEHVLTQIQTAAVLQLLNPP